MPEPNDLGARKHEGRQANLLDRPREENRQRKIQERNYPARRSDAYSEKPKKYVFIETAEKSWARPGKI